MKQITVTLYEFSELSEKAQERAMQDYSAHDGYMWADDALKSISALAEHFGGKVRDYSIDWSNSTSPSWMKFDMPDTEDYTDDELTAKVNALGTYNPETLRGNGDCVLTGFCMDESAIDGLRKAWNEGERDMDALMQAAFETWIKDCHTDYADFYSPETFGEHCEANDYYFRANGEMA